MGKKLTAYRKSALKKAFLKLPPKAEFWEVYLLTVDRTTVKKLKLEC